MSRFRSESFTAVAREQVRNKSDLVGVQEVRWDRGSTARAGNYIFFYGQGKENHTMGKGFLYITE